MRTDTAHHSSSPALHGNNRNHCSLRVTSPHVSASARSVKAGSCGVPAACAASRDSSMSGGYSGKCTSCRSAAWKTVIGSIDPITACPLVRQTSTVNFCSGSYTMKLLCSGFFHTKLLVTRTLGVSQQTSPKPKRKKHSTAPLKISMLPSCPSLRKRNASTLSTPSGGGLRNSATLTLLMGRAKTCGKTKSFIRAASNAWRTRFMNIHW
mmetsp:Transcript_1240/g.3402  ORF Transcript_1240/g.3402 Transcript_1240/m.3402 type:complete len:209 (+) Transcript_1240:513-1139(+)